VLKPHSACRNHSCVWCSRAYCVIYECRLRFPHTECGFYTQSVIYTRRVWFLHAECHFHTQCDVETHKCDYDTNDCDFNTHKSDFYTHECDFDTFLYLFFMSMSVIMTRTSVIYTRTIRVTLKRTKKQSKINVRSPKKKLDWVLTSVYTTSTSGILAPCVWF
jgi:hypothetical protein